MDSLISCIQFCEDCLPEPLLTCRLLVARVKLLLFSKSNLGRLLQWNSLILRLRCAANALHRAAQQRQVCHKQLSVWVEKSEWRADQDVQFKAFLWNHQPLTPRDID